MHLAPGKVFLKMAANALLIGLEEIPAVGGLVKVGRDCWQILQDEQEKLAQDKRIAQLEQAAACTPEEARQLAIEAVAELNQSGRAISNEQAAAVQDLLSIMPAQIQQRTHATLSHARRLGTRAVTVLPVTAQFTAVDREAFYTGLLPQRRPQFRPGDRLPHGTKGWRLEHILGIGGFGEVWLAKHHKRRSQLPMAVKFCQDEMGAKLLVKESEKIDLLIEQLPVGMAHIVALVDLQVDEMPYWLAFEYIDGGTLESRMRLGAMDWPTAWALFRPIVEGMAAVHELQIVHRDLKPANILLAGGTEPRIADFGIGKLLAEQVGSERRTQRSKSMTTCGYGSIGYMSPEQEAGAEAHPADDTFALGIILWQMLAGQLLDLRFPVLVQQLTAPDFVKAAINACVFFPCTMRPQNAQALLEQLLAVNAPKQPAQQQLKSFFQSIFQSQSTPRIATPPPPKLWTPGQVLRDALSSGGQGPEMVVIAAGSFLMGSPEDEPGHKSDEGPQHQVTISKSFAMGKFTVTFAEYDAFCAATERDKPDDEDWGRGNMPVINVPWDDAVAYCAWLSQQTGKTYRLPTEAEWEYAARAGTTTPFHTGNCLSTDQANYDGNHPYANCPEGKYRQKTVKVGSFAANPWGLHDTAGNVWEWTCSAWSDPYNGSEKTCNNSATGEKVLRGGSWIEMAYRLRSAYRGSGPNNYYNGLYGGFRVVF